MNCVLKVQLKGPNTQTNPTPPWSLGVGTDALAVGARVIGIDRSLTMCRESRARGLMLSVVGEAEALPFPAGCLDGCWADRTFQHLARPDRALSEMVRVLKPGGTIVVVDPGEAIAEAKAAGFETAASDLEQSCFAVAFTTSSEMLGEHGLADLVAWIERGAQPAGDDMLAADLSKRRR